MPEADRGTGFEKEKEVNALSLAHAGEIGHLLYLLDDSDEEVVSQVTERILSYGAEIIPILENALEKEEEPLRLHRLRFLIQTLLQDQIASQLRAWNLSDDHDLLDALLILNRMEDPTVDKPSINRILDRIKLDAWLELNYDQSSFEQIKILNYIFFELHQFRGNTTDYHHIDNSILSRVLQNKKGNPVLISVVYALVAQRLNIPVFGVNLPQHFVLGYRHSAEIELLRKFNDPSAIQASNPGDVLFYINAFSEGLVLNYESLKSFLEQLKIEPKPEYFNVCSNVDIVRRILRNMIFSYDKAGDQNKKDLTEKLLKLLNS